MNLIIGAIIILICLFLAHGEDVIGLPPIPPHGCKWVPYSLSSKIPPFAMVGGLDTGNYPMYVGRCALGGIKYPAKIIPDLGVVSIALDGREITGSECELLIVGHGFHWVQSYADYIPPNALVVDDDATDFLYIGRAQKDMTITVGKVDWKEERLFIGYNSTEIIYDQWETLVGPVRACRN